MSLCINPNCTKPENSDDNLFCQACGSELVLQGRYRIIRQLGGGGFGVTYELNEIRTNTVKVLKVLINNQQKAIELFKQEADVLSQLHHPGIPKVERDAYFIYIPSNSQNSIHCLVMEKIVGMDLENYMRNRNLRPIDQTLAIEWLKDLLTILAQVHSQNFFHRDIKPANIMLRGSSGALVLIDFGTARQVTQTVMNQQGRVTGIISAGYTPIEQMNNNAEPRSDFFALGRTFVYLLTGKDPLDTEMYDSNNDQLNWRNHAPQISSMLADLLDEMMARLPNQRPANTQIILQKLTEIEAVFQSSIPPTQSIYPIASPPVTPTIPDITPQPKPTRRRTMKFIGFGAIGILGAVGLYAIFPKRKSTLIVSSNGGGDYKTINEAIKNSDSGTTIMVRPGRYQERLILDKSLKIIGEGLTSEIILESIDSNCIMMQTDKAEVRGLTLRCLADQTKKVFAIDIPQGQLTISDCDITSNSLACVGIHGSTANPIIQKCKIHDGKSGGIIFYDNGKGTVEDCDIFFANDFASVEIRENGNPLIRRCKIHDGKTAGILVDKNGKGTVEDCDIFANGDSGVEIRESANPLIRRCKIYDGKTAGIFVHKDGQGTVEDCNIFGNSNSGVFIAETGNPLIRQCNINKNTGYAVLLKQKSAARIENSDLTGNSQGSIYIDSTSQVQRIGNKE